MELIETAAGINGALDELTCLLWNIGDNLNEIENNNDDPSVSPVRRLIEDGSLNTTEGMARLYRRIASLYGLEERALGLPWSFYAYCANRSKDPVSWVRKCAEERWSYKQLRTELLSTEARTVALEEIITSPVRLLSVRVKDGAVVSAYVSLMEDKPPVIRIAQRTEYYTGEEYTALQNAVARCIEEIEAYCGEEELAVEEECVVAT